VRATPVDQVNGSVETQEKVGYYLDAEGNPVAEVWEALPPPPNADYSRANQSAAQDKLSRLMGYDMHREKTKKEVPGVWTPASNLHGDSELASRRVVEVSEMNSREVYFNRQHEQCFPERDWERSDMYDGLNDRRSADARVVAPPVTERQKNGRFMEPHGPQSAAGAGSTRLQNVRTSRLEPGEAWSRKAVPTEGGAHTGGHGLQKVTTSRSEIGDPWERVAAGDVDEVTRADGYRLQRVTADRIELGEAWGHTPLAHCQGAIAVMSVPFLSEACRDVHISRQPSALQGAPGGVMQPTVKDREDKPDKALRRPNLPFTGRRLGGADWTRRTQ
jgi:hypothetical protein